MNEKILQNSIEQAQKIISQSKDWQQTYEEQSRVLIDNKTLLDQFHKQIKSYEAIQFYLVKVNPTQDNIFTIRGKIPRATYRNNRNNKRWYYNNNQRIWREQQENL